MKTKEESIKEAWGDNLPSEGVNENGWSNEYIWHECVDLNLFNTQTVAHGYYNRRPKSLEGIENNNGWIKVDKDDWLSDVEYGYYWFRYIDAGGKEVIKISIVDNRGDNLYQEPTHYKIVEVPKPPIY